MKGKFIVIDGVDGSGKGTQTRLLIKRLKQENISVLEADFPRYGEKSAAMLEEYLNGRLGSIEEIDAYQASVLYAIDRFAASKEIKEALSNRVIVISNRYVSSNKIHQSTKIEDEEKLNKFLEWLEDLEYNKLKIPRPDKVIFLNMNYKIGRELVLKKEAEERKYLDGKKRDLHEDDEEHMRKAHESACKLAKKYDDWIEIKCDDGVKPLSLEDIHKKVYEVAKKIIEDD